MNYTQEEIYDEAWRLVSTCASEIAIEKVDWLWKLRLARGKHTCWAGEPGASKSTLTMSTAAILSTGGDWPCGEGKAPCGSVIILSAEDGAADTITPRLHAAGADLGRVHIVGSVRNAAGQRAFNLQLDLALLEELVRRIGDVVLIIIDPVSSYMGKSDSHKNAEVRGVLEPLSEFADRMRVAVLSITHFSKGGANTTTKALHRFIGSIAFIGAPRIAQVIVEDTDNDRRLLLHAKNNLGPPPLGLAYRIKENIVGDPGLAITAPYVVWDAEHVAVTADQAIAADNSHKDHSASAEAEEFLREVLADGEIPQKKVKAEAEGAGLSWRTVRRAKDRLGIKPCKERGKEHGGWMWSLPQVGHDASQRAHVRKLDALDTLDTIEAQESQDGQDGQDLNVGSLPEEEAALAARRPEQIIKVVRGPQDRDLVLSKMVKDGEILEDQRDSVLLIRQIIVPWKTAAEPEKPVKDYWKPLETKAVALPLAPTEPIVVAKPDLVRVTGKR